MTVSVGVDGGQSTLRLAVAGTPLRAERPGFSFARSDPYGEELATIAACWDDVGCPGPVDVVALGLTGVPSAPRQRAEFARSVTEIFGAAEVRLCADMVTAHLGAVPDRHGAVLAAGTGVAALGVDAPTGRLHRVDGRGYLFGDDGSSFGVGRAAIAACLRADDGRGPGTVLTEAARRRYGPLGEMPGRLYASPTVVADTAAFAVDVDAAAAEGDQVASDIIAAAASELARTAGAAARDVTGDTVPVAGTGRWFGAPTLHRMLVDEIATVPRLRLVPAAGDALTGACRLATAADPGPYGPMVLVHRQGRCRR